MLNKIICLRLVSSTMVAGLVGTTLDLPLGVLVLVILLVLIPIFFVLIVLIVTIVLFIIIFVLVFIILLPLVLDSAFAGSTASILSLLTRFFQGLPFLTLLLHV
jgi:hypothetical protein